MLVREALAAAKPPVEVVRSAVAVAYAIAEESAGGEVEEGPGGIATLVDRTGLTVGEVEGGWQTLRAAGLVRIRGGVAGLEPDLLCVLPVLAGVEWSDARQAIERAGGRLAPALSLLRELGRLSRPGPRGGGEWLQLSVHDLVEETLYGRTAITQALGDLIRSGLVERAEQPARRGLRVRIRGPASAFESPRTDVRGKGSRAERTVPSQAGVTVRVGGAEIGVPSGSRLQLPEGLNYRLEIGPDGGAVIRIDD